ncbi:hypothetical protein DCS65_19785 [Bacillus subtilis]|nr:hypothetical protein DCS65_19785 [Bacillus subtilis]
MLFRDNPLTNSFFLPIPLFDPQPTTQIQELRKEVYEEIDEIQYRVKNTETLSAESGFKTRISFSGSIKCGGIETESSLNLYKQNEIASYQLLGCMVLTEVLNDLNISPFIKSESIIVQQNNYTSIEELIVDLYLKIKDMC